MSDDVHAALGAPLTHDEHLQQRLADLQAAGVPADDSIASLVPADATHHQMAHAFLNEMSARLDAPPVACDGELWAAGGDALWRRLARPQLQVAVGRTFNQHKNCRKVNDYKAIVDHTMAMADTPGFFADAPLGVVTPSGFHHLADGSRESVRLRPEHRQRYALAVDPDFDTVPARFYRFLGDAFDGGHDSPQAQLIAEFTGAALVGDVHRYQAALLLLGVAGSGKSVTQRLMVSIFPPDSVVSVSPIQWFHEYYVVSLAGARLNAVGELPDEKTIPAAFFKSVIGGDLVSGRNPHHRVVYFRPTCGHVFNSNHLPATLDPGDGFFRRWRVVHFTKPVPPEARDPDLCERILQSELGAVIAWALLGAERVARAGRLRTTAEHDAVMQRWRVGSNKVLLFLTDPDYCKLGHGERCGVTDLFAAYRHWSETNGYKPMSNKAYSQLMEETAGTINVVKSRSSSERFVQGVSLVASFGGGLL
jgi:putative DNA primase/helicase